MVILDTTVLVHAVGRDHPLREPSRSLLASVRAGDVKATTTPEVIQEFTHVRARRHGPADAARLGRGYALGLAPLVIVEADDLTTGLDLFERHPGLGCFDSVLAAAVLRRGAAGLVSADRAFASVERLRHLDPGAPTFVEDLATGA